MMIGLLVFLCVFVVFFYPTLLGKNKFQIRDCVFSHRDPVEVYIVSGIHQKGLRGYYTLKSTTCDKEKNVDFYTAAFLYKKEISQ